MNSESVSYTNASASPGVGGSNVPVSAVSWGAILAGAAGAASLSLILLMLGVGLGLSSVSPWLNSGVGAKTLGVSTIVWIIFTQLAAAGLGGYIAGRMRTRWHNVPVDEVYFRDTAHGFLAWSVATLLTAALLTSTISAVLGSAAETTASALSATMADPTKSGDENMAMGASPYQIDKLFRRTSGSDNLIADANDAAVAMPESSAAVSMANEDISRLQAEVAHIFAYSPSKSGSGNSALSAEDLLYVTRIVQQQTGLSNSDAETRVVDSYAFGQTQSVEFETAAKAIAEKTRKAAAHASLWLFISLLIGAFIASLSATLGARHRDD